MSRLARGASEWLLARLAGIVLYRFARPSALVASRSFRNLWSRIVHDSLRSASTCSFIFAFAIAASGRNSRLSSRWLALYAPMAFEPARPSLRVHESAEAEPTEVGTNEEPTEVGPRGLGGG